MFNREKSKSFFRKSKSDSKLNSLKEINGDEILIGHGSYGLIKSCVVKINFKNVRCAIKYSILNTNKKKNHFRNEINIFRKCDNHKNIIKMYNYGVDNKYKDLLMIDMVFKSTGFIIMELCKCNLSKIIHNKEYKLSDKLKLDYSIQIASGLKYMHSKKIAHRDVKPHNLLLSLDEKTIKICDFGTSKRFDCIGNSIVGSYIYFAPETILDTIIEYPKKLDVYSFGITLWEIWSRKNPYLDYLKKISGFHLALKVQSDGIRPNLKYIPESIYSKKIKRLIKKCWNSDPLKRPSFRKILKTLKKFLI
jgi:serine/threonine protein kinase